MTVAETLEEIRKSLIQELSDRADELLGDPAFDSRDLASELSTEFDTVISSIAQHSLPKNVDELWKNLGEPELVDDAPVDPYFAHLTTAVWALCDHFYPKEKLNIIRTVLKSRDPAFNW